MAEISIEEIAPVIKEVIDSGAEFRLYPKGKSMYPTIIEGEDSVMLAKPYNLKKYDAVFYRRDNGQYVLHRIVKVNDGSFDMCGDNQFDIEKNVPESCIIAKMSGIYKNDVFIRTDSAEYTKKIKRFCKIRTFRKIIYKVKRRILRLFKPITKK